MDAFTPLLDRARDALRTLADEDQREIYLTSIHAIQDDGKRVWHANYYHPLKDVLYSVREDGELEGPEPTVADVAFLPELDITSVRVSADDAEQSARERLSEGEAGHVEKTLLVLQMADDEPIWNITFFLPEGRVVNVHVSASSGRVLKEDRFTLFSRA